MSKKHLLKMFTLTLVAIVLPPCVLLMVSRHYLPLLFLWQPQVIPVLPSKPQNYKL